MKVVLISANGQEFEIGLRSIASVLKNKGHDVSVIYPLRRMHQGLPRLNAEEASNLQPFCLDADLIGVSYLSNFRGNARLIASAIRSVKKPEALLIAGGIHPTLMPEDALQDFQYVLRGEGEEAMGELADCLVQGKDYSGIRNLAYYRLGDLVLNPLRPIITDLDLLPVPFLEFGNIYFRSHAEKLVPLDKENMREFFWQAESEKKGVRQYYYPIHSARGCPHKCSFCVNDALSQIYSGDYPKGVPLRRFSPARIITELEMIRKNFPIFNNVLFTDDVFTSRPLKEIEQFSELYKTKVALPFECYVSAPTITPEKMDILVDAGLKVVSMGIQSGSDRMNKEIFLRYISISVNSKAVEIVAARLPQMDPEIPLKVHFISKCPWETREDVVLTAKMIARLPLRTFIILFGLNYFPGTKIFDRARSEGIVLNLDDSVENMDGWSENGFIFDRITGRPSPYAIIPLLMVQQVRFLPKWQHRLIIFLLTNPITFFLLGTWRFSSKIRKFVEFYCQSCVRSKIHDKTEK